MLKIKHKGSLKRTYAFLNNVQKIKYNTILHKYGQLGVSALASSTPKDSGKTAMSWEYGIEKTKFGESVYWYNTNIVGSGVAVALLIQYGHGTKNGGYVRPTDYINPTMLPIFDKMANDLWKEVSRQ